MQEVMALVRLCICAGSSEPLLLADVISSKSCVPAHIPLQIFDVGLNLFYLYTLYIEQHIKTCNNKQYTNGIQKKVIRLIQICILYKYLMLSHQAWCYIHKCIRDTFSSENLVDFKSASSSCSCVILLSAIFLSCFSFFKDLVRSANLPSSSKHIEKHIGSH